MKLKNINRGLVLGGVLIVGTVCYVVYGNHAFKKNIPDIEKTAEQSITAMAESNIGELKDNYGRWRGFVGNYMTDYRNQNDYSIKKSDIISEIQSEYGFGENIGTITAAQAEITDISVSKSGKTGATVNVGYSMYFEYSGSAPVALTFNGITYLDDNYEYDEYGNEIPNEYDGSYAETISGNAELYMIKESDGWKIASMNDYHGYSSSVRKLDDTETDSESSDSEVTSEISSEKAEEADSVGE